MKKLFLIPILLISALFSYAQSGSVATLMNNPANASGSSVLPDTTRAAGQYTFVSPIVAGGSSITIQCWTKKDSGTIAGSMHVQGTIDPAKGEWQTLVIKAGDSLLLTDGDNGRYWQFNAPIVVGEYTAATYDKVYSKADWYYYRVVLNQTNKARQRVKCYIRSR